MKNEVTSISLDDDFYTLVDILMRKEGLRNRGDVIVMVIKFMYENEIKDKIE